ncbi:MAG: N-formylglutamate amidohydrolase [Phycisphaeraceae bacterium]|nr:N-formylglutamate amidohydrolase [Phycisphaeraceae bacterium]
MSSRSIRHRPLALVVTCEHAGREVPRAFKGSIPAGLLNTHRAWDPGALDLAVHLAAAFSAPLFVCTVTRLLIDLNRSESNTDLWSPHSRRLSEADRRRLLTDIYRPFRSAVADRVTRLLKRGPVLHLSVHSFTPVLRGERRNTDVGLLFDPARQPEAVLCRSWRSSIQSDQPRRTVHLNRPYLGTADGHTTALRKRFPAGYAGVELEINQRLLRVTPRSRRLLHASLAQTLAETIDRIGSGRPSVPKP